MTLTTKTKNHLYMLIALSIFLGTVYTVFRYSTVGTGNQAEDLPKILRIIDNNYLSEDHFVNSSAEHFSIRFYYTFIMSKLIVFLGLQPAFFTANLLVNIATVFVTVWFTYRLFQENLVAGIVSGFLIYLHIYQIAGGYHVLNRQMVANLPAMFFILVAFEQVIIEKRVIRGALFLGLGSLLQPLSSIVGFAICVVGMIAIDILEQSSHWYRLLRSWEFWRKYGGATVLFMGLTSLIIVPYMLNSTGNLSNNEFVTIYGYFRIPHHSIPSYFFTFKELVLTVLFFLTITATLVFSTTIYKPDILRFAAGAGLVITILFICNYVFVEIIPTRFFVTLVPIMKLSPIIAWFGTVLISGFLTEEYDELSAIRLLIFLLILAYIAIALSLLTAVGFLCIIIFNHTIRKLPQQHMNLASTMRYAGIAVPMIIWSLLAIPYLLTIFPQKVSGQYDGDNANLFEYVQTNTDDNSVFVVPHDMVDFRIFASRAIVGAYKTYPANDQGLAEWYERMNDVYSCYDGEVHGIVLPASFPDYILIDDECLLSISLKYGADYAVVYEETSTDFPILYSNETYKLIRIISDNVDS